MGVGGIPCRLLLTVVVFVLLLSMMLRPASCVDQFAVVYEGCANKTFPGWSPLATVAALSLALSAQYASAKFYKTFASSASTFVFGLFQCRDPDCSSCIARAMSSWHDLCGGAVAAVVQLNGCLALYEISSFVQ